MINKHWEDKDMAKFVTIENKSKVSLHGLKPGGKKQIEVDDNGTPKNYHWRRRVKDAKIDGCVQIIKEKKEDKVEEKVEEKPIEVEEKSKKKKKK